MDETGTKYLDTRNNVAHCGHSHPDVVKAVQSQVQTLNTNTRYLHPHMALYAQRLVQLMPSKKSSSPKLQVVFMCNSGSEANDLALRLATAYSGGSWNTIVVDHAYHGHTLATLQVSPYKYERSREDAIHPRHHDNNTDDNNNDSDRPFWIRKVPCPDTYRGPYRDVSTTAGAQYAAHVQRACEYYRSRGERVRAFLVEGGMSVAGVIMPPPGYLKACAEAVRAAGGLYIADEVQTGLGRCGRSVWAFASCDDQDDFVVPDIVTIGKPAGNGMPLAAVVTTREVAQAFEKCGVEYFNTFGGNPVCAAAGLAVLDVLEKEGLQDNALKVGSYLKSKFEELQDRLELIGDVRGSGLFLGVELVRDRHTLEPAAAETSFICSTLKSKYHILTSIDGPHENVIVIKPPMVFGKAEADWFLDCFEKAATIDLLKAGDLKSVLPTPT